MMESTLPDPSAVTSPDPRPVPRVRGTIVVMADDLIWASRLLEAVRRAGATPVGLGAAEDLGIALAAAALADPAPDGADHAAPPRLVGAIVDLLGRRYDGVEAVRDISAARLPVIAVAEHDDVVTRRRAREAGALRVFSYRRFFMEGPRLVGDWLTAGGDR